MKHPTDSGSVDGADQFHVRSSRTVAMIVLLLGGLGLVGATATEWLREPFPILVFCIAALVGAIGVLDRRFKLSISSAGVRYARWGPAVVPWHDFSGFRWTSWRRQPYLELLPRRPARVLKTFSPVGRLNQACARVIRTPRFSIAVAALAIAESELEKEIGRYLQQVPGGP